MALPPGFLEDLRTRVAVSDVVGLRVRWDARRSNPAKGDFWACCPFHEEKSPSFHVDDRKGFYHCFGCHAKGDAVTFLREKDGMSFMEAVETLAQMAGVAMPAQDPAAFKRAEARKGLAEWMEAAVAFYRTQLRGARGAEALAYLRRRGLSDAAIARFEIGYAPAEWRALAEHLGAKGAPPDALLRAGLTAASDRGGQPYDRFRDRVMFPIRDARGACIAFGGRAMAKDERAKYLNSPDTDLFDKGRTLFNLGPAREAAGRSGALIVAEGYMDVIALHEGGFPHAVAPLGTAITEEQLRLLWRVADEPVLALDGDRAGQEAAARAASLALPLLEPGKSLRFALMPTGRDPDEVIRGEGPQAMRALLDAAEPLIALIWRRETDGRAMDTPERRAALDARLKALLADIRDPGVREHYRQAFAERRAALFRPEGARATMGFGRGERGAGGARSGRPWGAPEGLRQETRARGGGGAAREREAAILLALANHPGLMDIVAEDLAALDFSEQDLDALRMRFLSAQLDGRALCDAQGLATLRRAAPAAELGFARPGAEPAEAARGLQEALVRLMAEAALRREVREAEAALSAEAGGELDGRLRAAATALQRRSAGVVETRDGDEAHLSAALRAAITDEIWVKKPRRRGDSTR